MKAKNRVNAAASSSGLIASLAVLLWALHGSLALADGLGTTPQKESKAFASQIPLGKATTETDMVWAREIITEFCQRLGSDYGIKVTFEDFAESGSQEQILKFAQQLAKSPESFDAALQQTAKKLNPFFQGKLKKPSHKSTVAGDHARGTRAGK